MRDLSVRQIIYDTKLNKLTRTTPCWTVYSKSVHIKDLPHRIHVCDPLLLAQSFHTTRREARREAARRNKHVGTTALYKLCPIVYCVGKCSIYVKVEVDK